MNKTQGPVGHIDADCFYCSAERVRDEGLVGVPVGVLGNQGACVIAKSYEMKADGVKTGEPIWDALRKCPDGVYVKRDFRWYEVLSRAMLAIVRDLSTRVEYYSIDEFFFDATPPRGTTPGDYALRIRDRIMDAVGVPATVGIARSRTLAKLISDAAKPFGALAVLDADSERRLLESRPVTEITGIAGRREARLLPWGIRTCLDLAKADRGLIRELLTATGEAIWWELNGHPVGPIHEGRPLHKVLSRGGSFGGSTDSPTVAWAWAIRNLERLIEELEYHAILPGRLAVRLGYGDKIWGEGRVSLSIPSDRFDLLLDAMRPCVRRAWRPGLMATRMHLFADKLRRRADRQAGLFAPDDGRSAKLAEVKRQINEKLGRFAVRSAATLPLADVYRDKSNEWDICDVRGKTCF